MEDFILFGWMLVSLIVIRELGRPEKNAGWVSLWWYPTVHKKLGDFSFCEKLFIDLLLTIALFPGLVFYFAVLIVTMLAVGVCGVIGAIVEICFKNKN